MDEAQVYLIKVDKAGMPTVDHVGSSMARDQLEKLDKMVRVE